MASTDAPPPAHDTPAMTQRHRFMKRPGASLAAVQQFRFAMSLLGQTLHFYVLFILSALGGRLNRSMQHRR